MNATIVDLRYRMKDVLRAIDHGETVTVLYRGKAKATLVPAPADTPDGGTPGTADQPFFGLWRDRDDWTDPAAWVRLLRQPRAIPGETGIKRHRKTRQPK